MNAIVIEHVPIADLPPSWREQLSRTVITHARVTVRIEEEAPAQAANDTPAVIDARAKLRGSVLRYDNPLEPVLGEDEWDMLRWPTLREIALIDPEGRQAHLHRL